MSTPPEPTARQKLSRAPGGKARPAGFDLSNPTGPTNDSEIGRPQPAAETPVEAPPVAAPGNAVAHTQPVSDSPSYLARSDNAGTQGGGVPLQPAPAGGGNGGMVITLGSLVPQVDPETDLVQFNTQLPRYYVAAIELMIASRYGTSKKQEHARRALAGYIPEAFLTEAYNALYPGRPPRGQ